jgi:hypothetical protein
MMTHEKDAVANFMGRINEATSKQLVVQVNI